MDDRVYYVVGKTDISAVAQVAMPIDHIDLHPQYQEFRDENGKIIAISHDVAVVALKSPASTNQFVVLFDGNNNTVNAGTQVTVIGWGVTDTTTGATSSRLLGTNLLIDTNANCRQAYSPYIDSGMVCADAPGKDACQGDSGGPLLVGSAQSRMQVGIVSFGNGCAVQGFPTVYTRVDTYLAWIKSQKN